MVNVHRQGEWIYAKVGDTEIRGRPDPSGIQFQQVSPTYKQDDFQKAVDTIEGMLTRPTGGEKIMTSKCPAGLIELRNSLKREIEEERTASSRYLEASVKLRHYSKGNLADELKNIGTQELMHHFMIIAVTDIITEECGE